MAMRRDYDRLPEILVEAGFDAFVEGDCKSSYAPRMGAPSLPPGRYFRMHMIGSHGAVQWELQWRMSNAPVAASASRVRARFHKSGRFRTRSNSRSVVARSDCTKVPLAAGEAQEDETILSPSPNFVDTSLSSLAFCLFGGDISEDGMKPLTIVISFDVGEQVMPGGIPALIASLMHEFRFQSAEATFHRCIDAPISVKSQWHARFRVSAAFSSSPCSTLAPRHIDIDQMSDEEIQDIVITAHLAPRKCLGFQTPFQAILKEFGKDVQIRLS